MACVHEIGDGRNEVDEGGAVDGAVFDFSEDAGAGFDDGNFWEHNFPGFAGGVIDRVVNCQCKA